MLVIFINISGSRNRNIKKVLYFYDFLSIIIFLGICFLIVVEGIYKEINVVISRLIYPFLITKVKDIL